MSGKLAKLLCGLCLLLMLAGCGNKGPLFLPEDDPKKKTQPTNS
jgi:predicted small lipoprotein YifL